MKNFYKIAIAALTTAVMSASALAAPHDAPRHDRNGYDRHHPAQQYNAHTSSQWQNYKPAPQHQVHGHQQAAQKWQVRHKLPKMYQNSSYRVSSYQRHQLSKPQSNQQWYKVNGYYLLTDKKSDTILKVVRA